MLTTKTSPSHEFARVRGRYSSLATTSTAKPSRASWRIYHDSARHEVRDRNVTTALRGPFEPAHLVGDQSHVLATDTQKNTALDAKSKDIDSIENFVLELARHFVHDLNPVEVLRARWPRPRPGFPRSTRHARDPAGRRRIRANSRAGCPWPSSRH